MDSPYVEASFSTLFEQSKMSASEYLMAAHLAIDDRFGEGYSAEHPELVAAYMNVACNDFTSGAMSKVIGHAAREVVEALNRRPTNADS